MHSAEKNPPLRSCKMIALSLIAAPALLMAGCNNKPSHNSEAYLAAHGIIKGRNNVLRIGPIKLSFPPDIRPEPYTSEKIVVGHADQVTFDIDLATWFNPPPLIQSTYLALVKVTIEMHRVENITTTREWLNKPWESIIDHPELGLREYISPSHNGGWGYRMYEPIDSTIRTPKGGPIIYTCSGRPTSAPERCITYFQNVKGPYVEYMLSSKLIPRWREVHNEVVETVDSIITSEVIAK